MSQGKITKADIINAVAEMNEVKQQNITKKEISIVVSKFIDELRETIKKLKEHERIELRGFGTFGIKKRKARIARNPKTGEKVNVPTRKTSYFKPGRDLKLKITKGKK